MGQIDCLLPEGAVIICLNMFVLYLLYYMNVSDHLEILVETNNTTDIKSLEYKRKIYFGNPVMKLMIMINSCTDY